MDDLVQEIFNEIVEILSDGFQLDDIISITSLIMTAIQGRKELRSQGPFKKKILIVVFRNLAEKSGLFTREQVDNIIFYIESSLPMMVDNLKSLSRAISGGSKRCCWG